MKRKLLVAVIVLTFIAGTAGMASAFGRLATTNHVGSLLVFPLIATGLTFDNDVVDTFITIANTFNKPVNVKCYWVYCCDGVNPATDDPFSCYGCNVRDFGFTLTANQPIWFSASTGQGGEFNFPAIPPSAIYAELKCWAVNADGEQIKWNHLKGEATIVDFSRNLAAEYPAYSFNAYGTSRGKVVGTPGEINLNAVEYDACPKYLYYDFFARGADLSADPSGLGNPEDFPTFISQGNILSVVPCYQDLRQGAKPTITKLEFTVWDENERPYTGIFECLECFFVKELGFIYHGGEVFTSVFPGGLQTDAGLVRIWGKGDPYCNKLSFPPLGGPPTVVNPARDTGILGVNVSRFLFETEDDQDDCGGLKATNGWAYQQFQGGTDRILYDTWNW